MSLHLNFYRRVAEGGSLEGQLDGLLADWLKFLGVKFVRLSLPDAAPKEAGELAELRLDRVALNCGGTLEVAGHPDGAQLELMTLQLETCLKVARSAPLERLMVGLQKLASTLEREDALELFHQLMNEQIGTHTGAVFEAGVPTHQWGQPPDLSQDQLYPMGESGAVGLRAENPERLDPRAIKLASGALGFVLRNCQLYEEVRTAKRTLEESQAQIVHSSKLAAVGQLAAGVAHELNSPLGAVMLQLDAAVRNLKRERYEKVADKLDSAEKAAATAKEIISKLLFYSRDATKGLRLVNLNEVVHDTLALLGKQLSYDDLKIELKLGAIPKVKANQNELQQVVTNLLLNARDAVLESESKVVEVVTREQEGIVFLEVCDHGPGIPEAIINEIFNPFFTTKPVGRGTGLGLSVSYKIMEQHNGKLEAENRPNGGACFRMSLEEHR